MVRTFLQKTKMILLSLRRRSHVRNQPCFERFKAEFDTRLKACPQRPKMGAFFCACSMQRGRKLLVFSVVCLRVAELHLKLKEIAAKS